METGRKIDLALTGGVTALVLLGFAVIRTTGRFVRDTQWVAHTQEVRANLHLLDAQLREAKSDVRSFVITGDSTYTRRYRASIDSVEAAFAALQLATIDNEDQQRRLLLLRPLLDDRLLSFDRTLSLRPSDRTGLTTAATADSPLAAQLAIGEALSSRVGAVLAALENAEKAELADRTRAQHRSELALFLAVLLFAMLGMALGWRTRRSIRRDLDNRERFEHALRESEAKFAGIVAIAADAIITVDAQQTIVLFNDGAEQIFGYSRSQVIGKPLDMLLPGRLVPAHRQHIAQFRDGPETARKMGERRPVLGRRSNGEEFPADASISKLSTAQGPLFTVVLRDVTEQKRLERHEHVLAESGQKLVGTIDYAAVLQVVADLSVPTLGEWCLVDVIENRDDRASGLRRVASHHSHSGKDTALRALEARGLDDDSPSRILDVLRTGTPELIATVDDEWLEAHTEGEELRAMRSLGVRSLLIVPLVAGDRTIGAMTIGVDAHRRQLDSSDLALARAIADRASLAIENARLYDAARHASAIRDDVLSVVSHDLRNPLSAVAMCARTLLDQPSLEEDERCRLYQSTLDAVDWMHHLMEDLLDAASLDAGHLSVTPKPQSAPQLVERALRMLATHAAAEGVFMATEIDPATPLVYADDARIVQVLTNLIGNGIKYTPPGGRVMVGAAPRGAEVLFWVRDTGAGIAPEHLGHVFDRFWHLRGASRSRGTGLGLTIARGIVGAHAGRIWVESTVGGGSTFSFTLPAIIAHPERTTLPFERALDWTARPVP